MATTVEEWLAAGNVIKRERDDRDPIVDEYQGTRFEWVLVGQATPPCTYKCQRTGVLAHKRSANNRITPYICRDPHCKAYGRHRGYGNATFCDEHRPEVSE